MLTRDNSLRTYAALLVALAILIATSCTSGSGESASDSSSDPAESAVPAGPRLGDLDCETDERWSEGIDVIVFLTPDVTTDTRDAISRELVSSAMVETFTFMDKEASFAEFQEMFRETEQIAGAVKLSDMPPSFRISIDDAQSESIEVFADSFRDHPQVFQVVERISLCAPSFEEGLALCAQLELPSEAIVFLDPTVDQPDIDRISTAIAESGLFSAVTFMDKEAAFRDFQAMFAGSEVTTLVTIEEMPVSFHLQVPSLAEAQPLLDNFRSDAAVFDVIDGGVCDLPE